MVFISGGVGGGGGMEIYLPQCRDGYNQAYINCGTFFSTYVALKLPVNAYYWIVCDFAANAIN